MNHLRAQNAATERAFPVAHALTAAAATLAFCLLMAADPVRAQDRAEPAGLEEQKSGAAAELETITSNARNAARALEALQRDMAALQTDRAELTRLLEQSAARRGELDRQIAEGETKLAGLSEREASLKLSLVSRRAVLAEVLAALQRIGRDPPPALFIKPDDALASVRSAILLGAVVPEIRAETEALVSDLKELAALRQAIALERRSLAEALEANSKEQERLTAVAAEKAALQAESERRLERERKRAAALDERSAELERVISGLETQISRLRAETEAAERAEEERRQAIAAQLARARELAASAVPDKNRIAPAYTLASRKGQIRRPVKGETLIWFGADDGTGHALNGEVMGTAPGAPVIAPADGWVAFAGPVPNSGQVVIVDTGGGYHVLLAGMERLSVEQGSFVLAGEPLAAMGATALAGPASLTLASSAPTLYIEFRSGGTPVDPRDWWSGPEEAGKASNDT